MSLTQTPNYPVIVIHLDDGNGLTTCMGDLMPDEVAPTYDKVPRYFCRACGGIGV